MEDEVAGNENGGRNNNHSLPWEYWDVGNWGAFNNNDNNSPSAAFDTQPAIYHNASHRSVYPGWGHSTYPQSDSHLTCLKLGKRNYFEDGGPVGERHVVGFKRSRGVGPSSPPVPRCQVEGCNVELMNAKDYHRRHKVCEMHSKAPKVVVLGIEQRFCQQCSRFHVVSEFDDSKRSCRRRLAGHNERRRKSSTEAMTRNSSQETKLMGGRFPCISSTGRALFLLSSGTSSWVSPADLSSRSSAALRELIEENRAALLARQLFSDRASLPNGTGETGSPQAVVTHGSQQLQVVPGGPELNRFHQPAVHLTLDLMQVPDSSFGIMSERNKSKEEEDCCEIWNSLVGTHVV